MASLSQVAGVLSAGTKESTTARASIALSTKESHHSASSMSLERNYIIEVTVLTPPVFLRCTWLLEGFTKPRAELLSSRPITNPQGGLHTQAETKKTAVLLMKNGEQLSLVVKYCYCFTGETTTMWRNKVQRALC